MTTPADLRAEHGRADGKAAALLGLDGLLVTVATTSLAALTPGLAATVVAVTGLAALVAAFAVLNVALRPVLAVGGHRGGWVAWADRDPADGPDCDETAADVVTLARLARRKYRLVQAGADLTTAGLLLLTAAAAVAALG